MRWNWQQPDWPEFTWNPDRFVTAERQFLVNAGKLIGSFEQRDDDERSQLVVEALSAEAVTTSEIEGEILDRASVQSSVQRYLGLAGQTRRAPPAEQGIAETMVDLYRTYADPLSHDILFTWHSTIMKGAPDGDEIGKYHTGDAPMQIVSGDIGSPTVHFEAPPSSRIRAEMVRFVDWFNRTAPGGSHPLSAIVRSGIAHLYFESIHPFEDGNGRIGRAIAQKALAQTVGQPTIVMLAPTVLLRSASYYGALEAASRGNEITEWLAWFGGVVLEAQRRALVSAEFVTLKAKLLNSVRGQINARQERALLRVFKEGPKGFKGGLSAANYMSITGASAATATRDLVDLTEKNALYRIGELKGARYYPAIAAQEAPRISISADGSIVEG